MSFAATHLVGFGAGGAEAAASNLVFCGAYENGAPGGPPVTFSSCSVGTASATRYIIVCVAMESAFGISSITVGGAATTFVTDQSGSMKTSIYITSSAFTSGTTADIVIATAPSNIAIAVYAAYGLSSTTATATAGTGTDGATMSLATANPGVAVGIAGDLVNSSFTVSALTEYADSQIGSDTATFASGGAETTGATLSVVFDVAASPSAFSACCASFPR